MLSPRGVALRGRIEDHAPAASYYRVRGTGNELPLSREQHATKPVADANRLRDYHIQSESRWTGRDLECAGKL